MRACPPETIFCITQRQPVLSLTENPHVDSKEQRVVRAPEFASFPFGGFKRSVARAHAASEITAEYI